MAIHFGVWASCPAARHLAGSRPLSALACAVARPPHLPVVRRRHRPACAPITFALIELLWFLLLLAQLFMAIHFGDRA
eukprot:10258879-Alexandrium_andersonii.AAC.1